MTKTNFQPLALTQTADGKQAVQCSQLYRGLGLDESNYAHWVKRNILGNRWAIEGEDYIPLTRQNEEIRANGNNENNPTRFNNEIRQTLRQRRNRAKGKDFILTLDFAKMLAMQTRSEAGHKIRLYFLHC